MTLTPLDITLLFLLVVAVIIIVMLLQQVKFKDHLLEDHSRSLDSQLKAVKAELAAESEKNLKRRQEELDKRAKENFAVIAGHLDKDIREMKESFELNKKMHTETSASLKENLESAVKALAAQTDAIGDKAEHLANALKGGNKMQGCWGETILGNIFREEGLIEGRDYDQESTLRDEMGMIVPNEDSGKRMRPDFILHYPDNTDIIVDSKVSLSALSDYYEARDDAEREDAAKRNLESVKAHVKELSRKDYSRYLAPGRRVMDYVIMFIPNYAAFQLARDLSPDLFSESFRQNVLITTEETIMPFLRMIRTSWINVEQIRNQQQIINAAQSMIDRVHDFASAYASVGKKLEEALKEYDRGEIKLRDGGASIITSAKQVIRLGVPENPKKPISSLTVLSSDNEESL